MPDSTPFLPDPVTLTRMLRKTLTPFTHVDWVASTASTNADLLDMARTSSFSRPWLQGAHVQTQGRGRVGRTWQNRPGACLMFSCAFDVSLPPVQLPMLSPLAGVAACTALRAFFSHGRQHALNLKWPNDLLWRGAKLAGILAETTRAQGMRAREHVVVIGMGLNLRDAQALGLMLDRDIADWSQILGEGDAAAANAAQLVSAIAQHWQAGIQRLHTQDADDFARQYAQVDALAGKCVNIVNQGAVVLSGLAKGVNAHGQLLVHAQGEDRAVTVGEVSVRMS